MLATMAQHNATPWRRSPTPGEPVQVTMDLLWKQILQIDEILGCTEVDMRVTLKWTDRRVATQMEADRHFELPADIWAPSVRLPIAEGERETFVHDDASKWVMCVDPENGHMQIAFDYRGMVSNPMSLEGFPYDVDSLDLRFAGSRLLDGRPASASDYVLVPAEPFFATQFQEHLPEFTILGCTQDHYKRISGIGTPATYIVCGMTLRRKPMYYFWKVSFLLWLIFVLAMSAFLFEPHEIANRLSILTTMFLASAATLFTLQHLPASDKLHRIDKNDATGSVVIESDEDQEQFDAALYHDNVFAVTLCSLYTLYYVVLFVPPFIAMKCEDLHRNLPCGCNKGYRPKNTTADGREFTLWDDIVFKDPWKGHKKKGSIWEVKDTSDGDGDVAKRPSNGGKKMRMAV